MTVLDLTGIEFPISPSPDAGPFWDAIDRGELVVPSCAACNTAFWYPRSLCPHCGARDIEWLPHDGEGVIHAFCIHHHTATPHLRSLVPFVTALVELADGVRILGLVDTVADPEAVRCDQRVQLTVATAGGRRRVPLFVPIPASDEDAPSQGESR